MAFQPLTDPAIVVRKRQLAVLGSDHFCSQRTPSRPQATCHRMLLVYILLLLAF
jgi:hypothetical protein